MATNVHERLFAKAKVVNNKTLDMFDFSFQSSIN